MALKPHRHVIPTIYHENNYQANQKVKSLDFQHTLITNNLLHCESNPEALIWYTQQGQSPSWTLNPTSYGISDSVAAMEGGGS